MLEQEATNKEVTAAAKRSATAAAKRDEIVASYNCILDLAYEMAPREAGYIDLLRFFQDARAKKMTKENIGEPSLRFTEARGRNADCAKTVCVADRTLTQTQAMALLGISQKALWNYRHNGMIPTHKANGRHEPYFMASEILAFGLAWEPFRKYGGNRKKTPKAVLAMRSEISAKQRLLDVLARGLLARKKCEADETEAAEEAAGALEEEK